MRCDSVSLVRSEGLSGISIHAPRVRCDANEDERSTNGNYFNPRTSCEVRRLFVWQAGIFLIFQSTHLVWGATVQRSRLLFNWLYFNPRTSCEVRRNKNLEYILPKLFQSTHLVWGATQCRRTIKSITWHFNPRTSCEVRHGREWSEIWSENISIHAPRVRCDRSVAFVFPFYLYFNPRTSCEVRLCVLTRRGNIRNISIHAPRVRCDSKNIDHFYLFLRYMI